MKKQTIRVHLYDNKVHSVWAEDFYDTQMSFAEVAKQKVKILEIQINPSDAKTYDEFLMLKAQETK